MSAIGKRRTRIQILEVEYTDDQIGGQIPNRYVAKETWAQVRELTGQRAQEFRTVYNRQPIEIIIKDASYAITNQNIIIYKEKECVIHSVVRDPLNDYATLIVWV